MHKPAPPLMMTAEQRDTLKAWVRAPSTPQSVALRARIVLRAADGLANSRIAEEEDTSRPTVILWRRRFEQGGPAALPEIAPGRGRPVTYGADRVKAVVEATTQTKPAGATHWSTRSMARAQKMGHATVHRIWVAHGLQPHLTKRFKLSTDKRFTEKLTDVVGLYLNPPDKAIVLCVDEKSQIQALQRTKPGLPMKKGRCGTMTHDYKRHGTTTLFAALNVLEGQVIGECMAKHRHQEFLRFLRRLDREFPEDTPLHLIVDNYGTHNKPKVKAWLARHPRFSLHFTPTSSSWLNLVERWFRELTEKRIRRGSFDSVPELIAAIDEYLAASNADPRPFVWQASVESILNKIAKCKAVYQTLD
ncbi:MAG: IS630 family transposase [Chloroflexi bacterium]|nr:IS630 family transposase [Chloroflexota bacterium]